MGEFERGRGVGENAWIETSNDYHCEVKFKYGFIKSFMMSLLFENCGRVGI